MMKKQKGMSSQLEEDMIYEIMLALPLKSLVRFKSLSKQWCNLFSSDSVFARALFSKHQHTSSFIVLNPYKADRKIEIINVKGAKSQGELFQPFTLPFPTDLPFHLYNCCDGILCVQRSGRIFLWNPFTKWTKQIDYPVGYIENRKLNLSGFGYDSSIEDYKVVTILETHIEVMNLKINAWRIITSNGLPKLERSYGQAAYLDGNLYWTIGLKKSKDKIIRFDLKNERCSILQKPRDDLHMWDLSSKLTTFRGKLCFIVNKDSMCYEIWLIKEESNWNKVFAVSIGCYFPLCGVDEAIIFYNFDKTSQKPPLIVVDGEKKSESITASGVVPPGSIGTSYIASLISPD